MNYITSTKNVGTMSFEKINFGTPVNVAEKMHEEIIAFFKKNPNSDLKLQFGGYARLSSEFANALFNGNKLEDHLSKITTWQIHIFDQQKLEEALSQ